MTREIRDLAASIRQRLLNLAKSRGEEFQATLTRYALERFLYRLASSSHREEFLLKGAMLFSVWTGRPHRPTWDVDFLGRGEPDIGRLESIFSEVCRLEVEDDGLRFEVTVRGEPIREDQRYAGVRLHARARLGNARISIQMDVGFGDAVTPGPIDVEFPTLLGQPAPHLRAYPRETVVAEKVEILISLGMANSRSKDFYDLASLARVFEFDGRLLTRAIAATFERRGTSFPADEPIALTDEFAADAAKRAQWSSFLKKSRLTAEAAPRLGDVIAELRVFLLPPLTAARAGEALGQRWVPGGPWQPD
ncbi:MAG TPA: nucleotidyl transferase AbiEii/AbiGii toxin family protein [Kofleriaceae bacterium]|nr:nucleotidyl transferase AbiEii/AbiGii toxin family protein [Kofleriaceae bacterium]